VFRNGTQFDGKCYYTCAGNDTTYCGGTALLDIYNNTQIVALPLPSVQQSSGNYVSKGCWKEAAVGRALSNGTTSGATMTIDVCAQFCMGRGQKLFGVEYG
jgi:hypothetical protein